MLAGHQLRLHKTWRSRTHTRMKRSFLPELMHQSSSSSSLLAMLEEQPVSPNPVSPCSSSKSVSPNPTKTKKHKFKAVETEIIDVQRQILTQLISVHAKILTQLETRNELEREKLELKKELNGSMSGSQPFSIHQDDPVKP